MVGKPSKQSEAGEQYLKDNPGSTQEQIARAVGLSVSAVQKSKWWKAHQAAQKEQAK